MSLWAGPTIRLLRVDLDAHTARVEDLDAVTSRELAGGALLAAWLLLRETPPGLGPFEPSAPLVVAGSVVAGRDAPGLARCSFVARSPLTGAIGEGRVEGPFTVALAATGFTAIVVTGRADPPAILVVSADSARVEDAGELWGADTSAAVDLATERFGPCRIAAIGPAGERLVRFADIVTDRSFAAARTGVGAVMGAKRLKAIVLRDSSFRPPVVDPEALGLVRRQYVAAASANPLTRWQHDPPGFGAWAADARPGTFAVENYRTSQTNDLAGLAPRAFARHLAWSEAGCPGCPTNCIKGFGSGAGRDVAAARREGGLHQEAVAALGPNLGLGEAATVLAFNARALRLGVDPVSLGFTISFALEARARGLIGARDLASPGTPATEARFGNAPAIADLLEQVAGRDGPGAWLAEGARRAADTVGGPAVGLAMHVKGAELPVFDPRTSPGIALGYAVSPTGPRYDFVEHDADFDDVSPAWPHARELARPLDLRAPFPMAELTRPKVRAVGILARLWGAFDALEVCLFAAAPTRPLSVNDVAMTVRAITGWDTDADEVFAWGGRRLDLLRRYALREGLTVADDVVPDRFFDEPIDTGPFRGAVLERDAFAAARTALYAELGWDGDGVPPTSAAVS